MLAVLSCQNMAEASDSSECPVCHEDYTDPKILACSHLVCRKCVISWLDAKGRDAGCPLCRRTILSSPQPDVDVVVLVNQLPTDYATKVKLESKWTLNSKDVCDVCTKNSAAVCFCLQCDAKLCASCSEIHRRLPVSADHVEEELNSLTADQLAANRRFPCSSHPDKAAEMFCASHGELICLLCCASTHNKCSDVQDIASAAEAKRNEIDDQSKRLRQKEEDITSQIAQLDNEVTEAKAEFGEMRSEIEETFEDLQSLLTTQQENLEAGVSTMEDKFMDEKKGRRNTLDSLRATVMAHASSMEEVVKSAPDRAVLAMFDKLKARLDQVEEEEIPSAADDKVKIGLVSFDENMLTGLKHNIGFTGQLAESKPQEECTGVVKSLACLTEGTIQYIVTTEDLLSEKCVKSPIVFIRNLPWYIEAYSTTKNDQKYLSLFLCCDMPPKWSCRVKYELRILKSAPRLPKTREIVTVFNKDNSLGWGVPQFITAEKLTNEDNDFVHDGKVTLECHMAADAPEIADEE